MTGYDNVEGVRGVVGYLGSGFVQNGHFTFRVFSRLTKINDKNFRSSFLVFFCTFKLHKYRIGLINVYNLFNRLSMKLWLELKDFFSLAIFFYQTTTTLMNVELYIKIFSKMIIFRRSRIFIKIEKLIFIGKEF